MDIKIVKDPKPFSGKEGRGRKSIYPWEKLEVGQAFDVRITDFDHDNMRFPEHNRLAASCSTWNKNHPETKFKVRLIQNEEGVLVARAWRIA